MKVEPVTLKLNVDRGHSLLVQFWPTLASMRKHRKSLGGTANETTYGFFEPGYSCIRHGKLQNGVVGKIHVAQRYFGPVTFAHELQHFVQWWITVKGWDGWGAETEDVAELAGSLTNQFGKLLRQRFVVDVL